MVVLDCSVIYKWFVDETDSDKARVYCKQLVDGSIQIACPRLLLYELGNVFRYKNFTKELQQKCFCILEKFSLQLLDPSFEDCAKIGQIVEEFDITFYDASYLWLAKKYKCDFITADEKLVKKTKHLGESALLL